MIVMVNNCDGDCVGRYGSNDDWCLHLDRVMVKFFHSIISLNEIKSFIQDLND